MKNRSLAITVAVFALLLAAPLLTVAEPDMRGMGEMGMGPGGGPGMGGDLPLEMLIRDEQIAEKLKLTDDQREKLAKLFMDSRKEEIRAMADIQILKLELEDLMNQDNPAVKQVDAKIDEMSKLQSKLAKSKIHLLLDGKKILTEEQVEKVKKMLRERMKQGRERDRDRGDRKRGLMERGEAPPEAGGPGGEFAGQGGPASDEGIPPEFNSPFPSPEGEKQ